MAETDKDTETWLKRMSLATVIFAVSATLSTFKGGSYSTQSVINQALASDQWAFYQAKSMKQHLFELQAEQLKLQLEALPAGNPARADYETHIAELKTQIERYGREKHDIEARARELEAQRDEAKRHNQPFGIAVLLLQVTILLSSIASLMKAKRIWWAALPVGVVGLVYFADGFVGWF